VINLHVDLLSAEVSTNCEYSLRAAALAAGPPVTRRIEAVSHLIVVWRGHLVHDLSDKPRRIHRLSVGVPGARRSGRRTDLRVRAVRI
jgi:hypothetical protein